MPKNAVGDIPPPPPPPLPPTTSSSTRTTTNCGSDGEWCHRNTFPRQRRHRRVPPPRLLVTALLASLGAPFHLGFQLTLTNPCQDALLRFFNESVIRHYGVEMPLHQLEAYWSVAVASLFVGCVLGALALRGVAEWLGRRRGLIFSFALTIVAALLSVLSKVLISIELYTASRTLMGVALGISVGLSSIYLTECSPKACRGGVGITSGVMMQFGMLSSSVLGMPQLFGTVDRWWLIYAIEAAILLVITVTMCFLHESPGYLVLRGDDAAALASVQFFHNCTSVAELDVALKEIKEDMKLSARSVGLLQLWGFGRGGDSKSSSAAPFTLSSVSVASSVALRRPPSGGNCDRRAAVLSCVMAVAVVFTGVAVIVAYAVDIFRSTGMSLALASVANVALTSVSVFSSIVALFIVDWVGRRKLLLSTYTALLVINVLIILLMYAYGKLHHKWIALWLIVVFLLFMFFFAMGPGPLAFFMPTELFSQSARSAGQSWAFLVQMVCRTFLVALFLPLKNAIGGAASYGILFVVPILLATVYFYFGLPETKNRNIREIQLQFYRLPTPRSVLRRCCAAARGSDDD